VLTFGSLFSGIGGFDKGLTAAGMRCLWQAECDPLCRRVLAKHWPNVLRYRDVREVGADSPRVDLIAAGWPCTEISDAGTRKGLEGENSGLWVEVERIVRILRPQYVLLENVVALRWRGLDRVLGEMVSLGYDLEWESIPASAVGAPHIRDRIWIVARRRVSDSVSNELRVEWERDGEQRQLADTDARRRRSRRTGKSRNARTETSSAQSRGRGEALADANSGPSNGRPIFDRESFERFVERVKSAWESEPSVGGNADGLPVELDGPEARSTRPVHAWERGVSRTVTTRSEAEEEHRVARLHALGNSLIWQIPWWIGERILEEHRR
jgi:DNA (cytosine-5)-methyltransferase 1